MGYGLRGFFLYKCPVGGRSFAAGLFLLPPIFLRICWVGIICVLCDSFFGPGMILSEKSDRVRASKVWLTVVSTKIFLEVAVLMVGALLMALDVHHGKPPRGSLVVVISGAAPSL